jgi:ribosomal protein L32
VKKQVQVKYSDTMKSNKTPFTCPHCGHTDKKIFHTVCPACRHPYLRDYIDTQMHPRDPNPMGIYAGRFWAWVFLVLTLAGLALYLLFSFGLI